MTSLVTSWLRSSGEFANYSGADTRDNRKSMKESVASPRSDERSNDGFSKCRPRTFADMAEENEALRKENEILQKQLVDEKEKHAEEVKDLMYRLTEVEKRASAAALATGAKGVSVDAICEETSDTKKEKKIDGQGGMHAGGKEEEPLEDPSRKREGEKGMCDSMQEKWEGTRLTRGSFKKKNDEDAVAWTSNNSMAGNSPCAVVPVVNHLNGIDTHAPGTGGPRRPQQARMMRELKSIGALDEEATDARNSLDLRRLVGLGMWKWFAVEQEEDKGGWKQRREGNRPKMLQFLGVFKKVNMRAKPAPQVLVEFQQQPCEWWSVEGLVNEYRVSTVRGINMFYSREKVAAFLERLEGGEGVRKRGGRQTDRGAGTEEEKEDGGEGGKEAGTEEGGSGAVEWKERGTQALSDGVDGGVGGKRKGRSRSRPGSPRDACGGGRAVKRTRRSTSAEEPPSHPALQNGANALGPSLPHPVRAQAASVAPSDATKPILCTSSPSPSLPPSPAPSPSPKPRRPEHEILDAFISLHLLPPSSSLTALRNFKLERLTGYGLREYWLVPSGGALKPQLYTARFGSKIEAMVDTQTGKTKKMIEAVYSDRSRHHFDMRRLIDGFTGTEGTVSRKGIVGLLSKEEVEDVFRGKRKRRQGRRGEKRRQGLGQREKGLKEEEKKHEGEELAGVKGAGEGSQGTVPGGEGEKDDDDGERNLSIGVAVNGSLKNEGKGVGEEVEKQALPESAEKGSKERGLLTALSMMLPNALGGQKKEGDEKRGEDGMLGVEKARLESHRSPSSGTALAAAARMALSTRMASNGVPAPQLPQSLVAPFAPLPPSTFPSAPLGPVGPTDVVGPARGHPRPSSPSQKSVRTTCSPAPAGRPSLLSPGQGDQKEKCEGEGPTVLRRQQQAHRHKEQALDRPSGQPVTLAALARAAAVSKQQLKHLPPRPQEQASVRQQT